MIHGFVVLGTWDQISKALGFGDRSAGFMRYVLLTEMFNYIVVVISEVWAEGCGTLGY